MLVSKNFYIDLFTYITCYALPTDSTGSELQPYYADSYF